MTNRYSQADMLHRLVKEALDSGAATTLGEAEALFRGYRVAFTIGSREAADATHQAALLTGVALARRAFLGGVSVSGDLSVSLRVPLPLGATLAEAVDRVGGVIDDSATDTPLITIGGERAARTLNRFHIRTAVAGWRGGIVPAHVDAPPPGASTNPLASMLAAGLAVNEAFVFVRGGDRTAGRRPIGLSLWRPSPAVDWLADDIDEPQVRYLPSKLWLIGLGHLGQAYLWGLGLLPYGDANALSLVLQDVDVITPSTESTSILSDAKMVGQKKTRAMAEWAESRGFAAAIHERMFDADFRRHPTEPGIALCGLDNALGRRALDRVGFDFVVEAGLGRGHKNYRTMRLHTLPGPRPASEIWNRADAPDNETGVRERSAYQRMIKDGVLDQCGVTLLAGKAVGAPFVGAVAASLVLAEVLRLLHAGTIHQVLDLDLQGIEHRSAIPHRCDFSRINPGFVTAP